MGDFQPVLDEIVERTGLPIALDGIYRWVAFLPSRLNETVPVANRYFGVFQDGSLKVRGIEARRRDTPLFIAETQMELLELLAQAPEAAALEGCLPAAIRMLRRKLAALRGGRVPPEKLLVSQKLSRSLQEYRSPSPAAIAAAQLESAGKTVKPGQRVRFLYIFGKPGVYAWDLPEPPRRDAINTPLYAELLTRSARTVLEAQGIEEEKLRLWLNSPAGCQAPVQMSFQLLKVSISSRTSPPTG